MALSKILQTEIVKADQDPNYSLFSGQILISEDSLLYDHLGDDIKQYEELEIDPHVAAIMQKRKYAVIAREIRVENSEPGNKIGEQAVKLCQLAIKEFDFDQLCLSLLNAILVGRAFSEIMWVNEERAISARKKTSLWLPSDVRGRSPRRFKFAKPQKDRIPSNVEQVAGYELRHVHRGNVLDGDQLPKYKFVPYSWGSKVGNPNGLGVGSKLWWHVRFKREVTKFWLIFLDRFAQPIPYGHYPPDGSKRELEDFLSKISSGSWGALPDGYKVNLLEAARSSSVQTYEGFENWCDEQMSQVVLGETLTTSPQQTGGSRSATETHNEVRKEVAKADADLLSSYLREYLFKPIVYLNIGHHAPVPYIWRLFEEEKDLSSQSALDKTLFDMGFRRTLKSIVEIYGEGYEDTQAVEEDPDSLESVLSGMDQPMAEGATEKTDKATTEEKTPEPTAPTGEEGAAEVVDPEIEEELAGSTKDLEVVAANLEESSGFVPPAAVRANARQALEVRAEKPPSQRGMTPVGIARARDLMNGKALSLQTIKRMNSYFQRHQVDKGGSTWKEKGKGWQAWQGWGGDEGWQWSKSILERLNRSKADLKESRYSQLSINFDSWIDCSASTNKSSGSDSKLNEIPDEWLSTDFASSKSAELDGVIRFDKPTHFAIEYRLKPELAEQLAIRDAREGVQSPESLHITICYLGKFSEFRTGDIAFLVEKLRNAASNIKPFTASLGGWGVFQQKDRDILWAAVDSAEMADARTALYKATDANYLIEIPKEHGFIPHITLEYIPKGGAISPPEIPQEKFLIDHLFLSIGDLGWVIPFEGYQLSLEDYNLDSNLANYQGKRDQCGKGYSCGLSCIAQNKLCEMNLGAAGAKLASYLDSKLARGGGIAGTLEEAARQLATRTLKSIGGDNLAVSVVAEGVAGYAGSVDSKGRAKEALIELQALGASIKKLASDGVNAENLKEVAENIPDSAKQAVRNLLVETSANVLLSQVIHDPLVVLAAARTITKATEFAVKSMNERGVASVDIQDNGRGAIDNLQRGMAGLRGIMRGRTLAKASQLGTAAAQQTAMTNAMTSAMSLMGLPDIASSAVSSVLASAIVSGQNSVIQSLLED